MPATFPGVVPSQNTTKSIEQNMVEVVMGNGYLQRVPNGINFLRDHISIEWQNLNQTDTNTVNSFLDSLETGDYFTWTSPFDTVSKKYILEGPRSINAMAGSIYTIQQKVKQVWL
jgi:phage-related protein